MHHWLSFVNKVIFGEAFLWGIQPESIMHDNRYFMLKHYIH